jgi:hypothetical protein
MSNAALPPVALSHRSRAAFAARRLALVGGAAVAFALAACGGEEPAPADSAVVVPPADSSAVMSAAPDTGCVEAAPWRECVLLERLESAGLAPVRLADPVRQPSVDVAGTAYRVGSAEVHAYFLPDSAAAARAGASIDPASASRPSEDVTYTLPPLVITNGNLVAVLFARTERQLERIQLALTAGLPAAGDR